MLMRPPSSHLRRSATRNLRRSLPVAVQRGVPPANVTLPANVRAPVAASCAATAMVAAPVSSAVPAHEPAKSDAAPDAGPAAAPRRTRPTIPGHHHLDIPTSTVPASVEDASSGAGGSQSHAPNVLAAEAN